MKIPVVLLFLLLVSLPISPALCDEASLLVTNAWTEVQMRKSVKLQSGDRIVDVLRRSLPVATAFGGGFVTQIGGVPEQEDPGGSWFYYLNGVLANQGAASYQPKSGDHIWWEFHNWQEQFAVPGVIGAFPQPFRGGFGGTVRPTVVCAGKRFAKDAEELASKMREAGVVDMRVLLADCRSGEQQDAWLILLDDWQSISQAEQVRPLYSAPEKTGFVIRFTAEGDPYPAGKPQERSRHKDAGAVLAVGSTFNARPIWLITGANAAAVRSAVKLLARNDSRISGSVSVIVQGDTVINVF